MYFPELSSFTKQVHFSTSKILWLKSKETLKINKKPNRKLELLRSSLIVLAFACTAPYDFGMFKETLGGVNQVVCVDDHFSNTDPVCAILFQTMWRRWVFIKTQLHVHKAIDCGITWDSTFVSSYAWMTTFCIMTCLFFCCLIWQIPALWSFTLVQVGPWTLRKTFLKLMIIVLSIVRFNVLSICLVHSWDGLALKGGHRPYKNL